MALTRHAKYYSLLEQLRTERASFIEHWRDLSDFVLPVRSRFMIEDSNKGRKRFNKIIDNTGTLALRTMSAGMHSGLTSPARPWVRLTVPDPDLAEFHSAKRWLAWVTDRMLTVFARSNLYNVLPTIYSDAGLFGTAAFFVDEDDGDDVIRCYALPIGSYMLGNDHHLRPGVFAREFSWTVRQVVERFGPKPGDLHEAWSNISPTVKSLYENGNHEASVNLVHIVKPNDQYDPNKLHARHKRFLSCYYEQGGPDGVFLRESGYDDNPVISPRWDVAGEDVYGTSSPGIIALGDIKMLQFQQRTKTKAIDKMVDPPMVAPTSLKGYEANLLPGGITYVDDAQSGRGGFRPAHDLRYDIGAAVEDIRETQRRINSTFYTDLFLMLAMSDRREITAREVAERHEEKMLMLGPVLERLNDEMLDPLITRTFNIMVRRGMIPEPPEELQGQPLKVEYISIMSQAQKMIAVSNIERFAGFAGSLMQAQPEAIDKFDIDQAIDEYGEALAVSPNIIRDKDAVAEIRLQRAQAAEKKEQMQMLQQAAQGAKLLSEADTSRDSMLTQLTGGGGV